MPGIFTCMISFNHLGGSIKPSCKPLRGYYLYVTDDETQRGERLAQGHTVQPFSKAMPFLRPLSPMRLQDPRRMLANNNLSCWSVTRAQLRPWQKTFINEWMNNCMNCCHLGHTLHHSASLTQLWDPWTQDLLPSHIPHPTAIHGYTAHRTQTSTAP